MRSVITFAELTSPCSAKSFSSSSVLMDQGRFPTYIFVVISLTLVSLGFPLF